MKKNIRLKFLIIFVFATLNCTVAAVDEKPQVAVAAKVLSFDEQMQKKISVDFRNTPIEDVVKIMAAQAGVDMVTSPTVSGNVTATLTNVPLDEALDNILAAHNYGYVKTKNMLRIAPLEELNQTTERLISRIYTIAYADVTEVEAALKKFISDRGSLSANKGTSNIIVTDSESKIKAIDDFIDKIDRITPQIMVEVRIYDITGKDRFDLGVEWQAGRNTNFGTSGITGLGTNPASGVDTPFSTGIFTGAVGKTSGTTGALRLGWLTSDFDIDILLKAQEQNLQAKLLANPRILVLDNETATIKIISEIPYQEVTESSDGGSVGSTAFREVGVELEVLPHVTRNEMIRLKLKPKFSVQTDAIGVGGTTAAYNQPVVDTREADTTLLIKNGQTVVLGGLRKKEVSMQTNKIPFLGDLPMIGNMFRSEGEDTVISELVVFITPWIIENPVLSGTEQVQYKETEFKGPQPTYTRAENSDKKDEDKGEDKD